MIMFMALYPVGSLGRILRVFGSGSQEAGR